MKKKILAILIVLCVILCGCGAKDAGNSASDSGSADNSANTKTLDSYSPGNNENSSTSSTENPGNTIPGNLLDVVIKGDSKADFIWHTDRGEGLGTDNIREVSVQFSDEYMILLRDFGTGTLQCNIWTVDGQSRSMVDDFYAPFRIDGNDVIMTADMSSFPGFSFKSLDGECELHYEYGDEGGPVQRYDWKSIATIGDEEETESSGNDTAVVKTMEMAAGSYVCDNGQDSMTIEQMGDGSYKITLTLPSRDDMYTDNPDNTFIYLDSNVIDSDDENVTVNFETQYMADEGTAYINRQGYVRIVLKGANAPDYEQGFVWRG